MVDKMVVLLVVTKGDWMAGVLVDAMEIEMVVW